MRRQEFPDERNQGRQLLPEPPIFFVGGAPNRDARVSEQDLARPINPTNPPQASGAMRALGEECHDEAGSAGHWRAPPSGPQGSSAVDPGEVGALINRGYLQPKGRDDRELLAAAVTACFSDALEAQRFRVRATRIDCFPIASVSWRSDKCSRFACNRGPALFNFVSRPVFRYSSFVCHFILPTNFSSGDRSTTVKSDAFPASVSKEPRLN
jgi:hypothetical protein